MTQVTDKMVKAFRREAESNKWDILNENGVQIGFNRDEATRAGIEAALAVAEPPSPEDAEFEAAVDDLRTFAIAYGDAEIGTESAATYMRKIDEAERALLDLCGATREEVE